jgi:hypothetical protein
MNWSVFQRVFHKSWKLQHLPLSKNIPKRIFYSLWDREAMQAPCGKLPRHE